MKIRMIGKTSGTLGNRMIHVRGRSGRKFPFHKKPGEGYIYEAQTPEEVEEIFKTQNNRFAYYFEPLLSSIQSSREVVEFDSLDLEGLKEMCSELGIEVLPQDKERSLKRLLTAYNLGVAS